MLHVVGVAGRGRADGGRQATRGPTAGGRGRGGAASSSSEQQDALALAVLNARRAEEVGSVLDAAAELDAWRLGVVLAALGRDRGPGAMRAAEWTMEWGKRKPGLLNVVHYTSLLTQLGRRGRWKDAEAAFDEMKAAAMLPTVVAYNTLVSAYEKGGGQWERAEAVMYKMRMAGLQPTERTYNALISTYADEMLSFSQVADAEQLSQLRSGFDALTKGVVSGCGVQWMCV